jgi:hypothetical protein
LGYNTYIHGNVTRKLCITILNKQKYLFSKMEDRKVKPVLSGGGTSGSGEDIRKWWRRVNMVEILCTHV